VLGYSPIVEELANKAQINSTTYWTAMDSSIEWCHRLKERGILPRVYFDQIPERGKDRIPGIGEFAPVMISRYIGAHCSFFMKHAFPRTYGAWDPKVRNGSTKESGDALGGTNWILHRIGAWKLERIMHHVLPESDYKKRIIKLATFLRTT